MSEITASQKLTENLCRRVEFRWHCGVAVRPAVKLCMERFADLALEQAELSPGELLHVVTQVGVSDRCSLMERFALEGEDSVAALEKAVFREVAETLRLMEGPHSPGAIRFIEAVRRCPAGICYPEWTEEA